MAIIDPTTWQQWSNITVTGGELTKLTVICQQVDTAIKDYTKRVLEKGTYNQIIMAAPRTARVQLFRYTPIQVSGFQCFLNWQANGNPAAFDITTLQVPYYNYLLEASGDDPTVSVSGVVTYLQGGPWGVNYYQPPYSVSPKRVDVPGALMFNLVGGYDVIPADIVLAACLAVSKIRLMPYYGMMQTSESWNSYSYAIPYGLMMLGILGDVQIAGLLDPYVNYASVIG